MNIELIQISLQVSNKEKLDTLNEDFLIKQYEIYMDIYKHHSDLALKAYILFIAIIGVIIGFIFSENILSITNLNGESYRRQKSKKEV